MSRLERLWRFGLAARSHQRQRDVWVGFTDGVTGFIIMSGQVGFPAKALVEPSEQVVGTIDVAQWARVACTNRTQKIYSTQSLIDDLDGRWSRS